MLCIYSIKDLGLKGDCNLLSHHGIFSVCRLLLNIYFCLGIHLQLLAIDFFVLRHGFIERLLGLVLLTHVQLNLLN